MTQLKQLIVKVIALAMLLTLSVSGIFAQSDASIRFVHVIPDAVPVDVYVNGTLAVKNLNYGESSVYMNVSAGNHTVTATAAGLSATLWEQSVSVASDSATTYIASDANTPQFAAFSDNLSTTNFGTSRLAIIHALADGPIVSVQLAEPLDINGAVQDAGTVIVPEVAYGTKFGEFDLPANNIIVDVVTTNGDAVLDGVSLPLVSNTSNMAVIYGTSSNPEALLLTAPTTPAEDTGFVRFVHGVVDGPTVDVFVNDTLVAPGLTPENPTEHIALPAGDHNVVFVDSGSEDELGSTSLSVESGSAQTIAALIVEGEAALATLEDDLSGVDETTAAVTVLNTIDGATATVELSDGTVLGTANSGEQSSPQAVEAIAVGTSLSIDIDGDGATINTQDVVLYGGVYYNVIVLDGSAFGAPSLVIAPTAISHTLGSAPGAGDATLAVSEPAATEAPADTTTEETSATEAPVVVTVPEDVIVGEVALDPSANLNLRQYPNANALVLGQAPSGSQLIINGREGAPVALVEGDPPPPEAENYVDPVTELGEGQDLDPTQTWVNITYNTPDGGSITAWVLSQFLIITDDEGLFALRDLETVPGNIPGEAVNTDVTPPSEPEDIVTAVVINLNSGANLNIRRTPDVNSEVLGQLDLGTVVELVGLLPGPAGFLDDAEWALISHTPGDGGVITGWVSTGFISYQWNGEDTDLIELIDRGLISEADAERIGEIGVGVAPVSVSTPDPQVDAYVGEVALDPGANLNLRRTPDVNGEVLVQIPSGSFIIIEARTADGEWFRTSFEGDSGWVASQFLIVTFNGSFVADTSEIPIDNTVGTTGTSDEEDTEGSDG